MTPFLNTSQRSVEERFNKRHASARVSVERCNGVLKSRFRCLLKHRVLHYLPETAGHITNACAVLHNICNERNLYFEYADLEDDDLLPPNNYSDDDDDDDHQRNYPSAASAAEIRYRIAFSL